MDSDRDTRTCGNNNEKQLLQAKNHMKSKKLNSINNGNHNKNHY